MSAKVTSVAEFAIQQQMKGVKGLLVLNCSQDTYYTLNKFIKIGKLKDGNTNQLALCDLVSVADGCYSEVAPRPSEPQYYSVYIIKRVGLLDSDLKHLRFDVCDIREIIRRLKAQIVNIQQQIESHEDFLDTWCDEEEE